MCINNTLFVIHICIFISTSDELWRDISVFNRYFHIVRSIYFHWVEWRVARSSHQISPRCSLNDTDSPRPSHSILVTQSGWTEILLTAQRTFGTGGAPLLWSQCHYFLFRLRIIKGSLGTVRSKSGLKDLSCYLIQAPHKWFHTAQGFVIVLTMFLLLALVTRFNLLASILFNAGRSTVLSKWYRLFLYKITGIETDKIRIYS